MGSKQRRSPELDDKTLDDALLSLVSRLPDGLEIDRARALLPKPYQVAKARIQERLRALVKQNKVQGWSAKVVAPEPFASRARAALLEALDGVPKNGKQIRAALPETMRGKDVRLNRVIESLLADGVVFEHPDPKNPKTKRYARAPADPKRYIAGVKRKIDQLTKRLARSGIDREALIAALADREAIVERSAPIPLPAHPDALLRAVLEVRPDAHEHVLVSVRDLRHHLSWPKSDFDRAVLALARQGRITLHHHDHPSGLNANDREDLVQDDHGNYYVGLVLEEAA